jgi:hypothetical protein
MADFKVKVIAETQDAESSLKQVDKVATEATRNRNIKIEIPNYSDLSKNFRDLNKDIGSAANGVKDFYKVASKLPVGPLNDINEMAQQLKRVAVTAADTGRSVGDAGDVIKATLNATNIAAETLVSRLTKIALGLYVIKEAAGLLQGAFGGLFNETIGREIKLRETILKTQTTLASTNKVFKNGKEITDPYQKIVTLTGAVRKNIDSIRERSIALAGVTSGEVIEVFGMVASQVGQIGGGLKEAEDLAINFAAALGTFGIPLYQARQEIGSILRGDITTDSYLAKALGITNEDIAKAKTETGGVVKFLEDRLAAAVAGQRIAAEGFSGVVSNIKDLSELVSQNFGAGLLDPLLDSLTKVFDFLFSIRNEMFAISKLAGESIGTVANTVLKLVSGATGGARQTRSEGGGGNARTGGRPLTSKVTSDFGADDALNAAKATVKYVQLEFSKAFSTVYLQISTLLERVSSAFLAVGGGLAKLAKGLLSIKIETFKALIGAVESISPALLVASKGLGAFLGLWGKFMELPLVQELAQISAGMKVLEMTGVTPLITTGGTLFVLFKNWSKVIEFVVTQFNTLRTIIGGVVAYIGGLIAQTARAATVMLTAWSPSLKALQGLRTELLGVATELNNVAVSAQRAGASLSGAQQKVEGLKGGVIGMIAGFIKFQLIMFAITAAVSLAMERFSAYKEAQDKIANDKRVQEAIRRLATTYKDLGENATESQKRAKAFEQSLVNQDYDKAIENVEKLKKKVEELRGAFEKPTGFNSTLVGKEISNLLAALNPNNSAVLFDFSKPITDGFGNAVKDAEIEKLKAAQIEANKKAREVDKIAGQENVVLEAQKRVDLSKEYAELQRQQQNDLFQQRQTLAQKEVEIFRVSGELRIYQMEQANAKLIEGEEGASRTALEALNNYLSVRENGELAIEAAKKEITIEVTNLEKTIADYRFENEKKIAEIRKRSGENEKAMDDARRQAAGQGTQIASGGAFNTGLRTGPAPVIGGSADYHQDLSFGPEVDLRQQRELLVQLAQAYEEMGRKIVLSNAGVHGNEFPLKGTAEQQNDFILKGQAAHRNRPGGGRTALDFYTPTKTDPKGLHGSSVVNTPMYAPTVAGATTSYFAGGAGGAGVEIAKDNKSIMKLIHGRTDIPLPSGGPMATTPTTHAATATTELQSLDVGTPAIEAYAEAVRSVSSAMERFRTLQAALTEAKTAEAFDAIAKAAFPQVQLQQYKDEIEGSTVSLKALADTSADAYDPARLALVIDEKTRINIAQREEDEILAKANEQRKLGALTEQQLSKLKDDLNKKQVLFVGNLAAERKLREQSLDLTKQKNAIERIREERRVIPFDIQRSGTEATASMAQTFDPEDLARQRAIEAEVKITNERIKLEQDQTKSTEQINIELRSFAIETRTAADILGQLDTEVDKFKTSIGLIGESAKTLTDGYKGFLKSVLKGGNIQEAMVSMVQGFSDKFLNMALDAAFKPVESMLAQQFKDMFNIKDPLAEMQKANNLALGSNTTALGKLNTALVSAAADGIGGPDLPPNVNTTKSSLDYAVGPNVGNYPTPTELNITPDQTIEPAYNSAPFVPPATFQFFDKIPEAGADMSNLSLSVGDLSSVVNGAANQIQYFGASVAAAASAVPASGGAQPGVAAPGALPAAAAGGNLGKWQKGFGGVMTIAAGVGSIAGGIGMLKKKGTYNKLMGLSGIFTGLGTVVSQFSPGAAFGKRERGGPVIANRPYIVGEKRPELFVPSSNGTIIPSVPGGMSDPLSFEKSQNSDPTAAAQAALGRQIFTSERTSQEMEYSRERTNANSGLKVETIRMGNMNVVTEEQMFQALSAAEQRGAKQGEARVFRRLKNDTRIPGIR